MSTHTCLELRGNLPTRWPLRSYSLTFRLSKGIAMRPEFETDNRLTAESVWMLARGLRMFRRSQMRTDRSSEPDTTWKKQGDRVICRAVFPNHGSVNPSEIPGDPQGGPLDFWEQFCNRQLKLRKSLIVMLKLHLWTLFDSPQTYCMQRDPQRKKRLDTLTLRVDFKLSFYWL